MERFRRARNSNDFARISVDIDSISVVSFSLSAYRPTNVVEINRGGCPKTFICKNRKIYFYLDRLLLHKLQKPPPTSDYVWKEFRFTRNTDERKIIYFLFLLPKNMKTLTLKENLMDQIWRSFKENEEDTHTVEPTEWTAFADIVQESIRDSNISGVFGIHACCFYSCVHGMRRKGDQAILKTIQEFEINIESDQVLLFQVHKAKVFSPISNEAVFIDFERYKELIEPIHGKSSQIYPDSFCLHHGNFT